MNDLRIEIEGNFADVGDVAIPMEVYDKDFYLIAESTITLSQPVTISVPGPGTYQVRALFPSGERVEALVTVPAAAEAETPVVRLQPTSTSDNESLAWAYTTLGVKRAAGRKGLEGASRSLLPDEEGLESIGGPAWTASFTEVYRIQGWNDSQGFWDFELLENLPFAETLPVPTDQRVVARRQLHPPEWTGDARQWRPLYQSFRIEPPQPESRGKVSLFAVPPGQRTDMLLVDASEGEPTVLRPMVRGNNAQADALLAYLSQGAFEAARRTGDVLADQLDSLLGGKVSDPTSAVIAGYYMLQASTIRHQDWLKNLADWFAFIPDGAVIYARSLLYQETPDRSQALHYFLTAARRGIPMYTMGLQFLFEGLKFCVNTSVTDPFAYAALNAVSIVAETADRRSDVTSVVLPRSYLVE